MSSFSPAWLRLREPCDARARAGGVEEYILQRLQTRPLQVFDLGAGAGANCRFLAPRIGGEQDWNLVDADIQLLHAAQTEFNAWADSIDARFTSRGDDCMVYHPAFECRIRCAPADLARELDRIDIPHDGLVTASALLDLVSGQWLESLAARCIRAESPVWFALTYDGRMECSPRETEDLEVQTLFNQHQRQDKGFGPALGPEAASRVVEIFSDGGYEAYAAPSDWDIGPAETSMQHALLEGWFQAACEANPGARPRLEHWLARRRKHIESGRSRMKVGHVDMVGWPRR
jgi:hypothetical protein